MAFQFVHLQSFSRKADSQGRTTDFIFAEASRKPEASIHVANPLPPVVAYGVGVAEVQEMHDAAADAATISVEGGKSRRIRKDQKTLHTVIASHPYTMAEINDDPAKRREAEEWEKRTISWLRSQYGDDLKSVVRHEDESHFHLHSYIVPVSDPEMKAIRFHPGTMAKRAVMATGPVNGESEKTLHKRADAGYKAAMRAWQDSYHEAVGAPCGLTRLGPRRRSLTRDEWQKEKVQAKALQKTIERAREVKQSGDKFIEQTKVKAATIHADADRKKQAAARAIAAAEREKAAAAKARAAAIAEQDRAAERQAQAQTIVENAARYSGWAGRLRAVWDGLRKSKIVERIRAEFSAELDRVQQKVRQTERQLDVEREQRKQAEMAVQEARQTVSVVTLERDQTRSVLQRLRSSMEPETAPELSAVPTLELKLRPKFTEKSKQEHRR